MLSEAGPPVDPDAARLAFPELSPIPGLAFPSPANTRPVPNSDCRYNANAENPQQSPSVPVLGSTTQNLGSSEPGGASPLFVPGSQCL